MPARNSSLKLISLLSVFLVLVIVAFASLAQENDDASGKIIKQFGGDIALNSLDKYIVRGLSAGDTLYLNVTATSGNLDPAVAVIEPDVNVRMLLDDINNRIVELSNEGIDPLESLRMTTGEIFFAVDDDSGEGYSAALEYEISEDGDYAIVAGSAYTNPTFGGYTITIGINAPEALEGGNIAAVGDSVIEFETSSSEAQRRIHDSMVSFPIGGESIARTLKPVRAGDTLYVYVRSEVDSVFPIVFLRDYGGKVVALANYTDANRGEIARFEYTFPEDATNYEIQIQPCCGEESAGAELKLLLGLNVPEVMQGAVIGDAPDVFVEPVPVSISVTVDQISNVDQKAENFAVVATLNLRWQDPQLAFPRDECKCDSINYAATQISQLINQASFWPDYAFFNQQGRRDTQTSGATVTSEGEVIYFERFTVTLQAPDFDFRAFPFDNQKFYVRVASILADDIVVFEDAGTSSFGDQLGEEEWVIVETETTVETLENINSTRSMFNLRFNAVRHLNFYIFRIFLPITIILIVSWITFFLRDYGKRVDVSSANLLLFVAFNFTISGELPRLGYLTFLDMVLVVGFILTAFTLTLNVVFKRIEVSGRDKLVKKIDGLVIWLYPTSYVVSTVVLYILYVAQPLS